MARDYGSDCRVCGNDAGLGFEDLSPQEARNRDPARLFGLDGWLTGDDGSAALTLCDQCNQTASHWYVPEFQRWRRAAAQVTAAGQATDVLDDRFEATWARAEFFNVSPALFLKQLTTMLLAIAPPGFAHEHRDLAAYAAGPKRRGLPSRYQFYLALYHGPFARFVGYSARLNADTRCTEELVELAYPPFSCVLSLSGEASIETTNISDFAELGMDDTCIVDLDLLNGFGHTPYPADFRTAAALARDRADERRVA